MSDLSIREKIDFLESDLLLMEQEECPVMHYFAPNLYIREVHLKKGTFAVGHYQKFPQLNIMLKGKVAVTDSEGKLVMLEAPLMYVGEAGRKFGYVVEDTVWQNIYVTNETDIETLENTYIEKSEAFKKSEDLIGSGGDAKSTECHKFLLGGENITPKNDQCQSIIKQESGGGSWHS